MSSRSTLIILAVLGVLATPAVIAPELGIIPLISVIGFPLAYAYWALPGIFLCALLAVIFNSLLPFKSWISLPITALVTYAVLFFGASAINTHIQDDVDELVSGDINSVTLPLDAKVIAYQSTERGCTAFCVNALLSGTADRFLVQPWDSEILELNPDADTTSFQFERQTQCPALRLTGSQGNRQLDLYPNALSKGDSVSVTELLALAIARGYCLTEKPAKLQEANLIITHGPIRRGHSVRDLGFSLEKDTISAARLSVYQLSPDTDGYEEIFRKTSGEYALVGKPLFSGPSFGYGFDVGVGWNRHEHYFNRQQYPRADTWPDFLTQTLGFDFTKQSMVAAPQGNVEAVLPDTDLQGVSPFEENRKFLHEILEDSAESGNLPTEAQWSAFTTYWERLNFTHLSSDIGVQPVEKDIEIGIEFLANPDLPVPPRLSSFVSYLKRKNLVSDENLALMFLSRMKQTDPWSEMDKWRRNGIRRANIELDKLPNNTIIDFYNEMMQAAENPLAFGKYKRFMSKFYLFGKDGIPPLMEIVKTGLITRNYDMYSIGSSGLCRLVPLSGSHTGELIEYFNASRLPWHSTLDRKMVQILLSSGVTSESLWPLLDKETFKRMEQDELDRKFDRVAASNKSFCK